MHRTITNRAGHPDPTALWRALAFATLDRGSRSALAMLRQAAGAAAAGQPACHGCRARSRYRTGRRSAGDVLMARSRIIAVEIDQGSAAGLRARLPEVEVVTADSALLPLLATVLAREGTFVALLILASLCQRSGHRFPREM